VEGAERRLRRDRPRRDVARDVGLCSVQGAAGARPLVAGPHADRPRVRRGPRRASRSQIWSAACATASRRRAADEGRPLEVDAPPGLTIDGTGCASSRRSRISSGTRCATVRAPCGSRFATPGGSSCRSATKARDSPRSSCRGPSTGSAARARPRRQGNGSRPGHRRRDRPRSRGARRSGEPSRGRRGPAHPASGEPPRRGAHRRPGCNVSEQACVSRDAVTARRHGARHSRARSGTTRRRARRRRGARRRSRA
jgi:hypothetical protein